MAAKVRLFLGPAQCGKTTRLLDRYRDVLRPRKPGEFAAQSLWIGPSHQAVAQIRDALTSSSAEAFLAPSIVTFAGFAESIIAACGRRIRPITRLQKRRILHFVCGEEIQVGRMEHFAPVAQTAGFLGQIDELIAELKRRDIWPEQFRQSCRQPREHELAAIYEAYQRQLLKHDLYDAEGRFWAAREALSQSERHETEEYALIAVDGFSDFTQSQYDILHLLARGAEQMQISLTIDSEALESPRQDDGRAVLFAKTRETRDRLRQVFPEMTIEPHGATFFTAESLKHLEQSLFRYPHAVDSNQEVPVGIEIIAAGNVQGEVEEIAGRIKSLLTGEQASQEEIVVVFCGLEQVARRVGDVFENYGIPFSLGSAPRLASSPLVRSITALLQLHAEDWPFRQLLGVVGNRLIRSLDDGSERDRGPAGDPRAAMESCIRLAQVPAGKRALLEQIQHWTVREDSEEGANSNDKSSQDFAAMATLALQELRFLAAQLGMLPEKAPLAGWVDHLEQLAHGVGLLPGTEDSSSEILRKSQLAWRRLKAGLRSTELVENRVSAEPPQFSVSEFLELVLAIASDERLLVEQDAVGRVRILSPEAGRHISAQHVFLAGLSEQSFASVEQENRLFDMQAYRRNEHAGDSDSVVQAQPSEAMFLFYELATRATESLTLSYPALDAKAQTLPPSPLLVELERCFAGGVPRRSTQFLEELASSSDLPGSRSSYRIGAVARALNGDPKWLAGLISESEEPSDCAAILAGIRCIAERSEREKFGAYEGLLLSPAVHKALAQRFDAKHLWSPSQLESYAACPFRFFSEQLLSLQPPGDLELRSDPRSRGSLLHQVLAALHEQLRDAKIETPGAAAEDLIERFRSVLSTAIESAPLYGLQQSLREIERREIEAFASTYAQQEVDYRSNWESLDEPLRPAHFEVRFGPKTRAGAGAKDSDASSPVPFELDLGGEKILLTGQIDRVDVGRVDGLTVFNIIDYKSGKEVKLRADKIRSGQQLQLPLYALAAEQLLFADRSAVALAAGYWSIAGKGFQHGKGALAVRQLTAGKLEASEDWQQLQPEFLERIREIIDGIREGQFPVYNEDENCTRSCPYSTICRVAHIRSLEKQWTPTLASANT